MHRAAGKDGGIREQAAMHVASHAAFFFPPHTPFSSVNTGALCCCFFFPPPKQNHLSMPPQFAKLARSGCPLRMAFSSATELSHGWCSSLPYAHSQRGVFFCLFVLAPLQHKMTENVNRRTHSPAHTTHPPPAGTIP